LSRTALVLSAGGNASYSSWPLQWKGKEEEEEEEEERQVGEAGKFSSAAAAEKTIAQQQRKPSVAGRAGTDRT
jgi:hypothetical protein